MKRKFFALVLLVLYVFMVSCSAEPQSENTLTVDLEIDLSENNWTFAQATLFWVNEHRMALGLDTLEMDRHLASFHAMEHCKYMVSENRISHDHFPKRAKELKFHGANSVAENVASGFDSAEILVKAWLSSQQHKQVLEGNYTKVGFGILKNDEGKLYVVYLCYR